MSLLPVFIWQLGYLTILTHLLSSTFFTLFCIFRQAYYLLAGKRIVTGKTRLVHTE